MEETNGPLKAWIRGDPDADLWRSAIRNYDKLQGVRKVVLDRCALRDPLSEPRTHPSYEKELLAWRAKLRPFIAPGGTVAEVRPLESISGEQLNQDAVNLTTLGEKRRLALYTDLLQSGRVPDHRPHQEPVSILLQPASTSEDTADHFGLVEDSDVVVQALCSELFASD